MYIADMQNDKVYATEFSLDIKNPYFVGIQSLEDGSLMVTYCDDGEYDPLKIKQYVLDKTTLYNEIENLFK